jgi:hypothetical protein
MAVQEMTIFWELLFQVGWIALPLLPISRVALVTRKD